VQHPLATVIVSVAAWSAALQLVALAGSTFVSPHPHPARAAITSAWQQWDGNWYARIVGDGYRAHHQPPEPQGVYLRPAFYPGFPLLARGVYEVLHPVGLGVTGAMLLTNQLLVFALAILAFLLATSLTGSSRLGVRTVQCLLLFPFAYFLLAPFSEAAFLTFIAGFAWALQTRRYRTAAVLGAAASATRALAVVLPLILAIGYLEQHDWNWRSLRPRVILCCLTPLAGVVGYALYQWREFGSPTYSEHVEKIAWARSFTLSFWHAISQSFSDPPLSAGRLSGLPVEVFYVMPLLVAFGWLTWLAWRRFGPAMGSMCLLLMILPIVSGSMLSFNRYMLPLLPCFVVIAAFTQRPWFDFAYKTIGASTGALFLVMFTHGIWTG
jgi:hypothetical protein